MFIVLSLFLSIIITECEWKTYFEELEFHDVIKLLRMEKEIQSAIGTWPRHRMSCRKQKSVGFRRYF